MAGEAKKSLSHAQDIHGRNAGAVLFDPAGQHREKWRGGDRRKAADKKKRETAAYGADDVQTSAIQATRQGLSARSARKTRKKPSLLGGQGELSGVLG